MGQNGSVSNPLDRELAAFEVFDELQLSTLSDFGIITLGDFLGATFGLNECKRLEDVIQGLAESAARLRTMLPDDIVEPFQEHRPLPQGTGWISEERNDKSL